MWRDTHGMVHLDMVQALISHGEGCGIGCGAFASFPILSRFVFFSFFFFQYPPICPVPKLHYFFTASVKKKTPAEAWRISMLVWFYRRPNQETSPATPFTSFHGNSPVSFHYLLSIRFRRTKRRKASSSISPNSAQRPHLIPHIK